MADLLERASAWLDDQRTRHASRVVTNVRGSRTFDVSATIGRTTFEVDDGYGVLVQHESRDFLILAADLVLDGQAILPQRGDRIQEVQGSSTFVYEVTAPGNGPCWRYSDPYRKTLRIHSKQVESGGN
jgi:hypothetical protein